MYEDMYSPLWVFNMWRRDVGKALVAGGIYSRDTIVLADVILSIELARSKILPIIFA
jgi:hypothetical protein